MILGVVSDVVCAFVFICAFIIVLALLFDDGRF